MAPVNVYFKCTLLEGTQTKPLGATGYLTFLTLPLAEMTNSDVALHTPASRKQVCSGASGNSSQTTLMVQEKNLSVGHLSAPVMALATCQLQLWRRPLGRQFRCHCTSPRICPDFISIILFQDSCRKLFAIVRRSTLRALQEWFLGYNLATSSANLPACGRRQSKTISTEPFHVSRDEKT